MTNLEKDVKWLKFYLDKPVNHEYDRANDLLMKRKMKRVVDALSRELNLNTDMVNMADGG